MPDADTLFAVALAKALAARYGLPLDSRRVQVVGRALCKLLGRLDRWREGRYTSATAVIGPAGQVRVSDEWVD